MHRWTKEKVDIVALTVWLFPVQINYHGRDTNGIYEKQSFKTTYYILRKQTYKFHG